MGSRKKKNCFFCGQTKKLWEKKNTTKVSGELEGGGAKGLRGESCGFLNHTYNFHSFLT